MEKPITIEKQKLNRSVFLAAGVLTALCLSGLGYSQSHKSKPNILIIMSDDMGFSDPGCFGGEIATPNLDALAANGLRFTQFYNCARCCPTRASLLTGLYQHQVGLSRNGQSLTRECITIAEALKQDGFNTAWVGKWHLTRTPTLPTPEQQLQWLNHQIEHQPFGPVETYPANRGFDKAYGVIWGVIDHFDPFSLVEGIEPVREVPENYYFTDAITDKAIEYLREFDKSDKPFFMYLAHCAPHWPLHARLEDIEKYKGTYMDGWHKLRKDRFQRQLEMGLFKKVNTPLPEVQGDGPNWEDLDKDGKAFQARKMAVHAAMVDRIDQGIGKVVQALKEIGQFENTLILFFSDNGASPEVPKVPGYDRPSRMRDGRKLHYGQMPLDILGSEVSYTGMGSYWASAVNTPFRYWKQESFEGGVNTPLIVHWPMGLKTRPGSITDQVGHVMDIMPTCLELAGMDYPTEYKGHKIPTLEGKSLVPILKGEKRQGHEMLFFEHENGRAVRMGDWKLVAFHTLRSKWELYNMTEDRTETRDLAKEHPDLVKKMSAAWDAWFEKIRQK